jgi:hypothetical protein
MMTSSEPAPIVKLRAAIRDLLVINAGDAEAAFLDLVEAWEPDEPELAEALAEACRVELLRARGNSPIDVEQEMEALQGAGWELELARVLLQVGAPGPRADAIYNAQREVIERFYRVFIQQEVERRQAENP